MQRPETPVRLEDMLRGARRVHEGAKDEHKLEQGLTLVGKALKEWCRTAVPP